MSNIEFNDSLTATESGKTNVLYSRFEKSGDRPTLVNFLMKRGFMKSEKSANIALLALSLIFLLAAVSVIYFYFFYTPKPVAGKNNIPPQIQIIQKTQEYIGQGMSPEDARQRAVSEVSPQK